MVLRTEQLGTLLNGKGVTMAKPRKNTSKLDWSVIIVAVVGLVGTLGAAIINSRNNSTKPDTASTVAHTSLPSINSFPSETPAIAPTTSPTITPTVAPTTAPTIVPTAQVSDWRDLVRLDLVWETCPIARVVPSYIGFSQNVSQILSQIQEAQERGEFDKWPLAAKMPEDFEEGFSLFLDLTSLLDQGEEQINIEQPIQASVLTIQDTPESINVISEGECGFTGSIRDFSAIPLTQGLHDYKVKSSDAPFFYLEPKKAERFFFPLPCQAPGMYNLKLDIPYTYLGQRKFINLENSVQLTCPKSVNYLRVAVVDPDANQMAEINRYTWNGIEYVEVN